MFVAVERIVEQGGASACREKQTIVYRDAGEPAPAVVDAGLSAGPGDGAWRPEPRSLFRFSAVTFNSHRIHYDLPYATGEEGYPGLVVQGPFIAAKLFGFARRRFAQPLTRFAFRALAPSFAGQPVCFRPAMGEARSRPSARTARWR